MTTTLDQIKNQLTDILNTLERRLPFTTLAANQVVTLTGLSDIDHRLGLIQAGEFRTGNGRIPSDGFTGIRIGYPAFIYESEEWHLVGVNADVLQVGINATDGKLYAGGGVVTLDTDGITIIATTAAAAIRAYKFKDSGGDVLGGMYAAATDTAIIYLGTDTGTAKEFASTLVYSYTPNTGASASATTALTAQADDSPEVKIALTSDGAPTSLITINSNGVDCDTIIKGDTTNVLTVDAGLEAVGIGGAAESGFKLKVTGKIKATDFISDVRSKVQVNRATGSSAQTMTASAYTKIQFDTEVTDALNEYDNTTNYRFTAGNAGFYLINAAALTNSYTWAAGEILQLDIAKNGTQEMVLMRDTVEANHTSYKQLNGMTMLQLAANDYIEVRFYNGHSTDINLLQLAAGTHFEVFRLA